MRSLLFRLMLSGILLISLISCAQASKSEKSTTKTNKTMDSSKITNQTVKNAVEALQENNKSLWFSYFTDDAVFTDDGRKLDFKPFFENAFAHKEKFLSIDKVENDGTAIYGSFFAGQWGTFNVFFKFSVNSEGKINRLDIGQN